jgi:hypothetical protein
MKTKTIICPAEQFDQQFAVWYKEIQATIERDEILEIKETRHDGSNHYIMYRVEYEPDWD